MFYRRFILLVIFTLSITMAGAQGQGYQEKMNWPFDSETPITLETIRIGASITF